MNNIPNKDIIYKTYTSIIIYGISKVEIINSYFNQNVDSECIIKLQTVARNATIKGN